MRVEKDSFGEASVPDDAYYGVFTARASENFKLSGVKFKKEFIIALTVVKKAAALANMRLGKLDEVKGNAIVEACGEIICGKYYDQFILDVIQAGAGTSTNMNANEVIANLALERLGRKKGDYAFLHPNDHVNMSQSTNDVFHSAIHVAAAGMVSSNLLPELSLLVESLEKKSVEFKDVVKSGRTHNQYAAPLMLGNEFSGYSALLHKCVENVKLSSDSLLELALGGTAVGTGLNAGENYARIAVGEVAKQTGLPFRQPENLFAAMQSLHAIAKTSASLKTTSIELSKIASDLRVLSSSDVGELVLPALQPGSSIMPGKINPSVPEAVGMACCQVMGNDSTISLAAQNGNLELNVFMPVACYNLLQSIDLLSNAARLLHEKCVDALTANESKIKRHLDANPILATGLNEVLGYDVASKLVKKSVAENKNIREVVKESGLLSEEKINELLDAKKLAKPPE